MPFGLVKLGPDMREFHESEGYHHTNSGYTTQDNFLYGFSHVHVSGTGGGGKYGNILLAPFTGNLNLQNYGTPIANEKALLGYYSITSKKYNVQSELTATNSVGFHQYTFPKTTKAGVLIDAGHFIRQGISFGEVQEFIGSEVKINSPTEIEGYNRVRWGWNKGGAYTVYFYAVFDTKASSFATWKNNELHPDKKEEFDSNEKTGAVFYFNTTNNQTIKVKVGISFVSSQKAKQNILDELNHWDFEKTRSQLNTTWNNYLSRIDVKSSNDTLKKMFYTGLYHSFLMPVNRTTENPLWKSSKTEPYYDDFYAIWDTYRTVHPLITLIDETKEVEIVNSLLSIYKHENYLPDARSGNSNGRTQGGSNADIVIADAYTKGLKGIDYEIALKSMLKDAEVPPGDNEQKEGRGGLIDYNNIGYVSTAFERSGSRTIEYSNCDWAIAQVANGLLHKSVFEKYKNGANKWQNLWNKEIAYKGFNGFIMPKDRNGNWTKDLDILSVGSWNDYYYESNPWEYSLSIPHDVNKLIELCGGKKIFVDRLDTTFNVNCKVNWGSCLYNVANEPGFLTPCLYIWAGRPDKTSEVVRKIIKKFYSTQRGGLPGNDDAGAMSSWLVFHTMGIYPNAGQDVYLITAPHFNSATITMANGKSFEIEAKNLTDKNVYIQSAYLNGIELNQAWFKHTDIKNGGKLLLTMGETPNDWGSNIVPPSLSTTR
jgi:predicted alpha-1,2-mannosidase